MNLIAAVDNNWGIGHKGKLLVRIPEDQKYFKNMTTGKVVVMGRKTFESLPNKAPLAKRINIILTTDPDYAVDGAIVTHSLSETLDVLKDYDTENVFIIGGEKIYNLFLDYCDTAYITHIRANFEADAHFPRLNDDWEVLYSEDYIRYAFTTYTRKSGGESYEKVHNG